MNATSPHQVESLGDGYCVLRPGRDEIEYVKPRPAIRRDREFVPAAIRRAIHDCVRGAARWPLFIHGPAGSGKTCAALALHDYARGGWHTSLPRLADDIRLAKMGRLDWGVVDVSARTFWTAWAESGLCTIDEISGIAAGKLTELVYEVIYTAIDSRIGKPLVLVSNLSPSGIASVLDDRIASRACAGTVVYAGGVDRRIEPFTGGAKNE